MNSLTKIEFYDDFRCIADQCPFTCCQGWQIAIDQETYKKWSGDPKNSTYLCSQIKTKKSKETVEYSLKMGTSLRCSFLDDKGLCNIVLTCGEDYLGETCKTFPREENYFDAFAERSLSCACPEVVNLLHALPGYVSFITSSDQKLPENLPAEYEIRQTMMNLMKNDSFSLSDRLFLVFHMLLTLYAEEEADNLVLSKLLADHSEHSYLSEILEKEKVPIPAPDEKMEEIKELFLDISMNYRNVDNLRIYLQDIYTTAEKLNTATAAKQWEEFESYYTNFDKLLCNYVIAKIFSECCNEDLYEIILSFQMILSEYSMIKYSVFLSWLQNPDITISYETLRDYLVIFSRIIGYNPDGMFEFWEENFQEAIWELEYFLLLF